MICISLLSYNWLRVAHDQLPPIISLIRHREELNHCAFCCLAHSAIRAFSVLGPWISEM